MNNSSSVRRLPSITVGKDYVVGDLHGCYNLLERLLEQVSFDTSCDRLFSVGDLIDRGPDSMRCLQLLAEPWFYAVQGNHEKMMLNFFSPYLLTGQLENFGEIYESEFLANGGSWINQYYERNHQRMSEEFNHCLSFLLLDVPLIWVVGEGRSRFHVIHGELARPYHRSSAQIVWLDSDIDRWVDGEEIHPKTRERLYWGRTLMQSDAETRNNNPVHKGLSITFCGHTYLRNPRQVLSHLCIDTGAFLSMNTAFADAGDYGLTLFDVKEESWLRASYGRSGIISSANIHGR